MTIAEKIIANCSGRQAVEPGETLFVRYNLAIGTEIVFPQVLKLMNELNLNSLNHPDRMAIVNGHLTQAKEAAVGTLVQLLDDFALKHKVPNYFQAGSAGNCQTLLADKGLIKQGDLVIGSDIHTTTYGALGALATGIGGIDLAVAWMTGEVWLTVPSSIKLTLSGKLQDYATVKDLSLFVISKLGMDGATRKSVEIVGPGLRGINMDQRFILCNMIAESGAEFVWAEPDDVTGKLLSDAGLDTATGIAHDPNGSYSSEIEIDLSDVEPMVALPFSPVNCIPAREVGDVDVNQVIIGSCTGGSMEDIVVASKLLRGYKLPNSMRLLIFPSCHQVIREMLSEELVILLTEKGARIASPSCVSCIGSGPTLLEANQVGVYTTNRNYQGRYGPETAKVYLSGPLVAAASAITGKITDPRDL